MRRLYGSAMPSPETVLVVIACPHCGTRYQLAYEAIGSKGREVACAQCGRSWSAQAEKPQPPAPPAQEARQIAVVENRSFDELAEQALDEKFELEEQRHRERKMRASRHADAARSGSREPPPDRAETAEDDELMRVSEHQRTLDEIKAAVARSDRPAAGESLDPADQRRQQREFSRRQQSLLRTLPRARMRRSLRIAGLVALAATVAAALVFRTGLVQLYPQLAAPYAAIGLPVNIVGLDFAQVHTVKSLAEGAELLVVDGKIRSVSDHVVAVPPLVVTLVDASGRALYEWSMTAKAGQLAPGQVVPFETQLSSPPPSADGVRLAFDDGGKPDGNVAPVAMTNLVDDSPPSGDDGGASSGGS